MSNWGPNRGTLSYSEIHAHEADYPTPGLHRPQDNTFLYERGNTQQYVLKYGCAFPIRHDELGSLGGVNRAVEIPGGHVGHWQCVPNAVENDLIKPATSPQQYHATAGRIHPIGSPAISACLQHRSGKWVQAMPQSLIDRLRAAGRIGPPAACTWPNRTRLLDRGDLKQYQAFYGGVAYIGPAEAQILDLRGVYPYPVDHGVITELLGWPFTLPQDRLFRGYTRSTVYHTAFNRAHPVPSPLERDCLKVRFNIGVTEVPDRLEDRLRARGQIGPAAACTFDHGQFLVNESNLQFQVLWDVGYWIGSPDEVIALGGRNKAERVSNYTTSVLASRTPVLPNDTMVRAWDKPEVHHGLGDVLHHVQSYRVRDCLLWRLGLTRERVVPGSFVGRLVAAGRVGAPAACDDFNGRMIMNSAGNVSYVDSSGVRHYVQNPNLRDCIKVRAGAGDPIRISDGGYNDFPVGIDAFCPYPENMNFVQENDSPHVWLVSTDGTKRHVGSLCVVDPYTTVFTYWRVWIVPSGEVAGHRDTGEDWFATPENCAALENESGG